MNENNNREELRKKLLSLDQKRNDLEQEILAHQSILKSNNITMNESLVDNEGYPRADVDIWAVRSARNKIIMLENDARQTMNEIEKIVHQLFSS